MPYADITVWRVELSFSIAPTATNVGGMLKRFKQVLMDTRIGCSTRYFSIIWPNTRFKSQVTWHDFITAASGPFTSTIPKSGEHIIWIFCFYCSTHSPLSLGILALSITFCTCSASFSALKDVKKNRNALILTTFEPFAEEYTLIFLQRLLQLQQRYYETLLVKNVLQQAIFKIMELAWQKN